VVGVVGAVGAVPLILASVLSGEQQGLPNILNTPPVALVETHTEYRVRVRIPQAVTWAQFRFLNGYCTGPPLIVNTTGAFMVAALGISSVSTMQYFSPLL
jgi:hypothetical protein